MTPYLIQQKIFFGYAKAASKLGAFFSLYRPASAITPIQSSSLIGTVQMSQSINWEYDKANAFGNSVFNACLDAQASSSPLNCRVGDYLVPTIGTDVQYHASAVGIAAGGSGYHLGDIIVVGDGSFGLQIILTVTAVSGSIITSVSIANQGLYNSPLPSNPLTQYYSTGAGLNATFNITWSPNSGIDNNNTYYVQSLQFDLPPKVIECNETISIIRPSQATGIGNLGYVSYTKSSSITIATAVPCSFLLQGAGGQSDTKLPTDTRVANWIIYLPTLPGMFIRNNDIIIDSANQEFAIYENEDTELGWRLRAVQIINFR
jgi:hypothetical protein